MSDRPEWFAAKRYGLGAGLPISWRGWLVMLAYSAVIIGAVILFGDRDPATFAVIAIATGVLLVITARTTRGGWRWRWGDRD